MKKSLAIALLIAVSVAGCAVSGPTLSKSDAEDLLFAVNEELDFPEVLDDGRADAMDIDDFVDELTDDVDVEFDPKECYNSTFALLLLDRDEEGPAGRAFIGETVITGIEESGNATVVSQWARWFESPGEAASFFSQYKSERAACTEFTVDTETGDVDVTAEVEDVEGGDEAFVLKTEVDLEENDDSEGEQYVIRVGNVIMMLSGTVTEQSQKNGLHDLVDAAIERLEDAAEDAAR